MLSIVVAARRSASSALAKKSSRWSGPLAGMLDMPTLVEDNASNIAQFGPDVDAALLDLSKTTIAASSVERNHCSGLASCREAQDGVATTVGGSQRA